MLGVPFLSKSRTPPSNPKKDVTFELLVVSLLVVVFALLPPTAFSLTTMVTTSFTRFALLSAKRELTEFSPVQIVPGRGAFLISGGANWG
jgi:hypothetical protein